MYCTTIISLQVSPAVPLPPVLPLPPCVPPPPAPGDRVAVVAEDGHEARAAQRRVQGAQVHHNTVVTAGRPVGDV